MRQIFITTYDEPYLNRQHACIFVVFKKTYTYEYIVNPAAAEGKHVQQAIATVAVHITWLYKHKRKKLF